MLNALCELIIDELKSFSASRRTISPSSLLQALSDKAGAIGAIVSKQHISDLKNGCLKILDELNCYFCAEHRTRTDALAEDIRRAASLGEIYLLLERTVDLISLSFADSHAKEKSLAQMLIEVGAQLGELESECLGLIESTAQIHRANGRFTTLIESEIAELENSAGSSENVVEVREVLQARLQTIKSALEAKKAEDSARKQTFESTIQNLQNSLKEMQYKIERSRKRRKHLEHEALLDPLTGISNRRVLERYIKKEIRRHKRDKAVFSLIFIDIDDFKKINDTYGHRVGDKCLQSLVERMKQVLRKRDLMARYGGDEFVILLAETRGEAAHVVADKLASAISKTCFVYRDSEIQLSVSIGLTQLEEGDSDPEEIIERADSALFEAKNQGKDCVILT